MTCLVLQKYPCTIFLLWEDVAEQGLCHQIISFKSSMATCLVVYIPVQFVWINEQEPLFIILDKRNTTAGF